MQISVLFLWWQFGKYDEDSTLVQHIQDEAVQMTNTAVLNTED
jgi:hypothetical protein